MFDALVPIPRVTRHWWNTQAIELPDPVRGVMGVACIVAIGAALRTREARTVLVAGCVGIFAVTLFVYTGYLRHWGHVFVIVLVATWIDRMIRKDEPRISRRMAFVMLACRRKRLPESWRR